jgi:trans-aconitate 2-methyltransferase
MTVSSDWDAATYDRVSGDVQFVWALEQLERLALDGDEVVLDAGCGTGRVTAELVRRVPRGRVYGVDQAPSMVQHAREALGQRATILEQGLTELSLPEQVDVVFSNATFHWIKDHDALFRALAAALKPSGRLIAQCGGKGNIDRLRRLCDVVAKEQPFAEFFSDWVGPWNYAGPEETRARLEDAGFADIETWLEPKPVTPAEPEAFVRTVCLLRHLDHLPEELKSPFITRVLAGMGEPLLIEYVRLNMTARRA